MDHDLFGAPRPAPLDGPMAWSATREAGLARLQAFLPRAGRAYARDRNVDRGPADRSNVSALSPWIRRRMITEEEVIAAVLRRHDFQAAEKFVQEVFWRTYWKGWLEMRPGVLRAFNEDRLRLAEAWAGERRLRRAMDGRTGIDCFDAWVGELEETGFLHNHARMWFASIWIFTLRLPWQLGADFFYKRLLDADPASNTLSWRWVAGLHTRGKHYLARAANIRENTLGRFDPAGALDERAAPLEEDAPAPAPAPPPKGEVPRAGRAGLLLTEEDLHPESWTGLPDVAGAVALRPARVGDPDGPAARFGRAALEDALARQPEAEGMHDPEGVARWARAHGLAQVITGYAPTGLIAWELQALEARLNAEGIALVRLQRAFDAQVWPLATAGFFKLKSRLPDLVRAMR
jgi:deoxyribodipyrimidine photo-lyase